MSIITHINFSLATDQNNEARSYLNITSSDIFGTNEAPISHGLCDATMGPINKKECETCKLGKSNYDRAANCQGHRGVIKLNTEFLAPIAIMEIFQWLKIICHKCGELLINKDKLINIPASKLLSLASSLSPDIKTCKNCKVNIPKIIHDPEDNFTFWAEYENKKLKLYPYFIKQIFERITPETLKLFKKNENTAPKNYVLKTLSVIPNTLRPPMMNYTKIGNTNHEFTTILQCIVNKNISLASLTDDIYKNINKDGTIVENMDRSIQVFLQLIYDLIKGNPSISAKKRGITAGGVKVTKSLLRKLPGKREIIRNHLLGKRVCEISRCTISGNSSMKIDEIGIPIEIAKILEVEETVQDYNYEYLMQFFLNGTKIYPGCAHIIRKPNGKYCDVNLMKEKYLEIGDIVCRHVVDGDLALFNRQPTLKSASYGVHTVKVITDPSIRTFQCNVLSCINYGADFDGDQMSVIIVRGVGARVEAELISNVSTHFIFEGTSNPLNGQVQDSIVGLYDITRHFVKMDKIHALNVFSSTRMKLPILDDKIYTGHDIISLALSETSINYKKRPSSYNDLYACLNFNDNEKMVEIEQGIMINGVLDSKSIGQSKQGSLFHIISREYGKKKALNSIFVLQQIALQFMMYNGFTLCVNDIVMNESQLANIHSYVTDVLAESDIITNNLINGRIIPPIGMTVSEYYEQQQKNALQVNDANIFAQILQNMSTENNGFFKMVACGAKGSNANFKQICATIDQIKINGERIETNYCFGRVLPYSPRYSKDPKYKGFCANSYISGTDSVEFINMARRDRYALIGKAIFTAITGYFLRKGVLNHQNSIVDNYLRVTKDNKIIQYIYGEDGLNPKELEEITIPTIMMSDKELQDHVIIETKNKKLHTLIEKFYDNVKSDRDLYRDIFKSIENTNNISFSNKIKLPINVKRFIEYIVIDAKKKNIVNEHNDDLIIENIERINTLCDNLPYAFMNKYKIGEKIPEIYKLSTWRIVLSIRAELTPRILKSFNSAQLTWIIENINNFYNRAIISPGTAVGLIAAQVICEPLTQGMLNSSHKSATGGSSKAGLVKINEIYMAKKVEEEVMSAMRIPLNVETEEEAKLIASSIEYITFKNFIREVKTIIEPFDDLRYPPTADDQIWINEYKKYRTITPNVDLTNICFRFVIDKSSLILKSVSLELIIEKLLFSRNRVFIVYTPETSKEIIIRIWLLTSDFKGHIVTNERINNIKQDLINIDIRGSKSIIRTQIQQKVYANIESDGAIKNKNKFIINTTGTNLYNIALHNAVDTLKITSNSVDDTYNMFGIVAARNKIITETAAFLGDDVPDYRHLQIYADEMTRLGFVTSIERIGLNMREPNNILLQMAIGDPIRVVSRAAINNIKSKVVGPSSQQMVGMTPQVGTSYNKYIVDNEFVSKNIQSMSKLLDEL